jgi:hypothetical protein
VVEVSMCEAEFQRRAGERYEHGGGSGAGGGGVRGFFRRARGKDLETLMSQEPLHMYKLG